MRFKEGCTWISPCFQCGVQQPVNAPCWRPEHYNLKNDGHIYANCVESYLVMEALAR